MNIKITVFLLLSLVFFPKTYSQQTPEELINKFVNAMEDKDTAALGDCFFSNKGKLHKQAHVNLLLNRQRYLDLTGEIPLVGNTMFGITLYLVIWDSRLLKNDPVIETNGNKGTIHVTDEESGSSVTLNIRNIHRWYFSLDHKGSSGIIALASYFPELLNVMEQAVHNSETEEQYKERVKEAMAKVDSIAENPLPNVLDQLEENNLSYYVTDELPGYSSSSITKVRSTENFYNVIVAYGQASTFESDLVVLNKYGKLTDKLNILSEWGGAAGVSSWSEEGEIEFLNDTLVEVRSTYHEEIREIEGDIDGEFKVINKESKEEHYFNHYVITGNGKVKVANWSNDWSSLEDLNKPQLRRIRNKVYAKYGYAFKSEDLQKYFSSFDWYEPRYENVDDKLTDKDRKFVNYILELEKQRSG